MSETTEIVFTIERTIVDDVIEYYVSLYDEIHSGMKLRDIYQASLAISFDGEHRTQEEMFSELEGLIPRESLESIRSLGSMYSTDYFRKTHGGHDSLGMFLIEVPSDMGMTREILNRYVKSVGDTEGGKALREKFTKIT